MNFNPNNIFGIILGWITAVWGYIAGGAQFTAETVGNWQMSNWAAVIGSIGVIANLYFAWARHRREVLTFQYENGLREDRRHRLTREGEK